MSMETKMLERRNDQATILRKLREKKEAKERMERAIKELHDKLALNYRYFRRSGYSRDEELRTDRIISVGWKIVLDISTDTTSVQYAVALCGKNETFSRKDAQYFVDKRFDAGFVNSFKIDLNEFPEKTINALIRIHYNTGKNDANKLGMRYVNPKRKDMPAWAKFIP